MSATANANVSAANKFNTVNTAQKNVQGFQQYMEHAPKMMHYFSSTVMKDKLAIKALGFYKSTGYRSMNEFLMGDYNPTVPVELGEEPVSQKDVEELRKKAFAEYIKNDLKPMVKMIAKLDELILNAPKMFTEPTNLYRGMNYDIQNDLECTNGKYYYTFKNFVSTSFKPSVSKMFMQSSGSTVMYTLIVNNKCKGLYIPGLYNTWSPDRETKLQNIAIDGEVEFLIGRGAKFEVVSVEFIPWKKASHGYASELKYTDIACLQQDLFHRKHYVLKFVSLPTPDALEDTLKQSSKKGQNRYASRVTFVI